MSATIPVTLTGTFTAHASGAGAATFTPDQNDAEWAVATSTDGTLVQIGNRVQKTHTFSLTLAAGQYLMLRGRGTCAVTADNPL